MSKIILKQVNNETVTPIDIKNPDKKDIIGYDMFPEVYSNIFLVAKKKSGKSQTIYNIVKKCSDKNSKFVIFASTVSKDPVYKHMVEWLEERGNIIITYKSIKDGNINNLEDVFKILHDDDSSDDEGSEDYPFKEIQDRHRKKKKPQKIAPEIFFIFDDLSKELQSAWVSKLLKENRHHKSKVIISSQWLNDLRPEARKQLDVVLLFGGHVEDKLIQIYQDLDLSIPLDKFFKIYKHATADKYNFLYIDAVNEIYRKNFHKQYFISNDNI